MERDLKISNIKGLLILLVVFGHVLEIFWGRFTNLYLFIYAFHMPLFIFISGYLAKRINPRKIFNLLLLYLCFQTLYLFAAPILTGSEFKIDYLKPYYHLWYLVSTIAWYLGALIIKKVDPSAKRKIQILLFIILLSAVSRFFTKNVVDFVTEIYPNFTSYTLSYQRTVSFASFFFLGYFLDENGLERICTTLKYKLLTLVVSVMSIYYYIKLSVPINNDYLFRGSFGIEELRSSDISIFLQLGMAYLASIWLSYLILNLASNKKTMLTTLGDKTLTIFLYHPFFVMVLGIYAKNFSMNPSMILLFTVTNTLIIVYILSLKSFARITYFLNNPYETYHKIHSKLSNVKLIASCDRRI